MVDLGESDKLMKVVNGKIEKSDTYKEFSSDISFFIQEFLQSFPSKYNWGNRLNNGENEGIKKGVRGFKEKRQIREEMEREVDVGLSDGGMGYWFWL